MQKSTASKLLSYALLFFMLSPSAYGAKYDIFVDKENKGGKQDGSKENPFSSINEAIEAALKKSPGHRKIFVANGKYNESVVLEKSVKIFGQSSKKTVISGGNSNFTVKMNNDSTLKNIKISGGKKGVLVSKNASVTIASSKVEDTKRVGIEISQSNKNNKAVIKNSQISDNDGKGLYILKKTVSLENNAINGNKQEGVDIRQGVKGTINKNDIKNNKESGIEVILGNTEIAIKNNDITGNKASGVSTQFYPQYNAAGSIDISQNNITGNNHYGVNCGVPQGGGMTSNYWKESVNLEENTLTKNKQDTYATLCNFQPQQLK